MIENWNENIQINLKGFSGSKIQVIRSGQKTFVRKTAKDRSNNNRIQKEILETIFQTINKLI